MQPKMNKLPFNPLFPAFSAHDTNADEQQQIKKVVKILVLNINKMISDSCRWYQMEELTYN